MGRSPGAGQSGPAAVTRWLPALESPDYRVLWFANFNFGCAHWIVQLALAWTVLELTNSPAHLGILGVLSTIPLLVFAIPGGILADRLDRRLLIVSTQSVAAALMGLLALLAGWGVASIEHIYVVQFLVSSLIMINSPAWQALVAASVPRERLVGAFALNSATFNTTRILGPIAGGLLLQAFGPGPALGLGAVLYLAFGLLLSLVPDRRTDRRQVGISVWANVVDGLRYTFAQRTILGALALLAVPMTFAMPYQTLLPAYARDDLGLDEAGLGLLQAAAGAGALLGTSALALVAHRVRPGGRLLVVAPILFGLGLVGLAVVRAPHLAVLLLVLIGLVSFTQVVLTNSTIQLLADESMRGRVASLFYMIWGLVAVGTLPLSGAADLVGTGPALAAGGALTLFGVLALAPRARHLWRRE